MVKRSERAEATRQVMLHRRLKFLAAGSLLLLLIGAAFYYSVASTQPADSRSPIDATSANRDEILIGLLAPLQGEHKAYGESIVRGATLAVEKVNASTGVLGKNLKLITADTRSSPEITAELTQDLIRRAHVSLILGTESEEEAIAAARVATEGKTPFIYLGNGKLKTCTARDSLEVSPYVWGTGFTDQMTVEPFLIYLADKLRRPETSFRIYYFGTDDEQSKADARFTIRTAESLGFETLAEEYVDGRIRDYFQRIRSIFNLNPDLLLVSTSKANSPLFLEQAAKLGVKAEMAVGGIKPFEEELVTPLGSSLDGIYSVLSYAQDIKNETNDAFLAAWKKRYPDPALHPTDIAVAGAYTAILLAEAAFNKAQSTEADAFRTAMANLEVIAPQGRVVVDPSNNTLIQPLYAVRFEGGSYVVDEYLGDVSHPGLEACSIGTIPGEDRPVRSTTPSDS